MGSQDRWAAALRRAAVCGTLAASIYNTQPWRFRLTAGSLELWSDPERQLLAHDPDGRLLMMSCGCALFNARVSLAADGVGVAIDRPADTAGTGLRQHLLATLALSPEVPAEDAAISELAAAVDLRRTNRGAFTDGHIPADLLQRLSDAAVQEGAVLTPLVGDQPKIIRELTEQAVAMALAEPSHRAERRAWSVAAGYAPTSTGDPRMVADLLGGLPLMLGATAATPYDWLRAGEALQRVLLELTRASVQVSLSSDAAQIPELRQRIRTSMALTVDPLVVVRIGHAPPSPATRRRRLVDVIVEPRPDDSSEPEAASA